MRLNGLHRPSAPPPSVERELSPSFFFFSFFFFFLSSPWHGKARRTKEACRRLLSFLFIFFLFCSFLLPRAFVHFSRRAFSLSLSLSRPSVRPIEPLVPRYKIVSCYKLESLGETFRPIKILLRLLRSFVVAKKRFRERRRVRRHVLLARTFSLLPNLFCSFFVKLRDTKCLRILTRARVRAGERYVRK